MVGVVTSQNGARIIVAGTQGPQGPQGPAGGTGGDYTNATPVPVAHGGIDAGDTFNAVAISDMLTLILYPYQSPLVTLSTAPTNSLREFGNSINSVLLTANTTVRTNPITDITFKRGAGVLQTGLGTTYNELVDVVANTTFSVEVDDGSGEPGLPVTDSKTFSFVYPFYWGVGAPGLTITQIAALTKIIQTQGNKAVTTSPSNEVYYFAYPSAYGALSDILDDNQFSVITDYTYRQDEAYVGLDATSQDYDIYEFDNLTTQTNFTNTYIF